MTRLTWSAAEFLREMMEPGEMLPAQREHAESLLTALSGGLWTPDTRALGEPSDRQRGCEMAVVSSEEDADG